MRCETNLGTGTVHVYCTNRATVSLTITGHHKMAICAECQCNLEAITNPDSEIFDFKPLDHTHRSGVIPPNERL